MNKLIIFVYILFLISFVNGLPSRRARCAVECYLKCVSSGTPNAVYCNCPDDFSECNSITDEFLRARTTTEVPAVETIYKDVRTIKVILKKPFPSSFIYVFEYSAVSDFSNKWIYAGSSSSPQMTFTIPDSCRDYQFRVLVVVRSTDPKNQLVVFQPRAIPVELPNFSIPTEMIRLDPPRQSSDGQSLHVFVSWQIPQGYFDSDIIGYESPVAYPIRCMIPEDSLSQPRVEKVQDGARMHLNLPIDVLDENCRIYLEVRMLAKCERVVPFDVQASVELNCQKFPMLDYCKKEMSPQCAEIVDVWGENGKAQIVWQPPVPNRIPLYYSISHGVTRSQGAFPFVTRKIIQHHEIRIPGNQTRLEIPAQPGVQSGIQICAVFSERQSKNPFNIVPVIPFVCKTCGTQIQPNCIECTKVEDLENMVPIECLSQNCATNNLSTHFISMNTANLNIKDSKKENIIVNSNSLNPLQRHSKIISTDKAIPVNSDFEDQPFQTNGTLDLLFGATTDSTGSDGSDFDLTSTTSLPAETTTPAEVVEDTAAAWTTTTEEEEEITTIVEATVEPTTTTTTKSTSTSTTTTAETSTTTTTSSRVTTTEIPEDVQKGDVRLMPVITPSDNSENFEEDITEEPQITTTTTSKSKPRTTQTLPIIEYEKRPTNRHKIDGIRLHPSKSQKPCKQKNGIICEFGCMDNLRCDCPKSEKSCIRGIHCPFVRDLRAIYENSNKTLKLFSKQISSVLKSAKIYDKIYLEFGEIGPATTELSRTSSSSSQQGSMGIGKGGVVGDFVFTTHEKERAVITLEHTNISKLFDEIPYIMFVEKPLKVGEVNYGLSVCALNSSLVPVIMDNVFMEQSLFNENSISSFTQTLLSPIDLNEDTSDTAKRSLLLVGAPFLIIFITIIMIGTFLCINIIRDKRRSPSEKFRRRGILRDQSSTHFTGFRPNLGINNNSSNNNNNITSIGINTPLDSGDRTQSARFFPRNVHF